MKINLIKVFFWKKMLDIVPQRWMYCFAGHPVYDENIGL